MNTSNDKIELSFESMVNDVCLIFDSRTKKRFIRKTYASVSPFVRTPLPTERGIIEKRIYRAIEARPEMLEEGIIISSIIGQDDCCQNINLEYLKGAIPLRQLPISEWPPTNRFQALGKSLATISQMPHAELRALFSDCWSLQELLGRTVMAFKLGLNSTKTIPEPKNGDSGVLTLGDVSLGNVLAMRGRLALVDFEFAHISRPGYDIGQLLGELRAKRIHPRSNTVYSGLENFEKALLEGYTSAGGIASHALDWAHIFVDYYIARIDRFIEEAPLNGQG